MLKGISRQIVEITDTGSPYFERAWLVVRPDCAEPGGEILQQEGRRMLRHAAPHTGLRMARQRRAAATALTAFLTGGGGVLLGFLLFR
ncbi:MAG: hypothetical protein J6K98_01515 [Clostridia bacterium]|nr:hypothetical protein [Clostridia bacterium]